MRNAILTIACLLFFAPASAEVLRVDYEGFTLWIDCDKRAAVRFRYNAQRDTDANFPRAKDFFLDPGVPRRCQQLDTGTYKARGQRYDRGHLVPANHLDYSKKAIRETNYMTNILPQAANFNRGAWLLTEEIVECYRDREELLVLGGVIWSDAGNEFFVGSHGVVTPGAFWKVIIKDGDVIAWIIPNSQAATRGSLDRYLVTVKEIERVTGEAIPAPAGIKNKARQRSWGIPRFCDRS